MLCRSFNTLLSFGGEALLSIMSKEVVKFLHTGCWPRWKGLLSVQFIRILTFGSWVLREQDLWLLGCFGNQVLYRWKR